MDFILLILLNAVLFIRPGEVFPALGSVPFYNILILCCLAASMGPVLRQLCGRPLSGQPITVCIFGVWGAIAFSHLMQFDLLMARTEWTEFSKIVLYYVLMISVLNSPGRLQTFLGWLVAFIGLTSLLALLQHRGVVDLPALRGYSRLEFDPESGEMVPIVQLRGTGYFNDPNDLCLILIIGVVLSAYRLSDRRMGLIRGLWLAPMGLFVYALIETRSRGGFLGLLASLLALFVSRFGWRRAAPLAVVVVPAMFLLSGGRQTEISTSEGTAQDRILLWSQGLHLLMSSPRTILAGIGAREFVDHMGLVAHNSFVHAFTELGLPGGTFFLGAFYLPVWSLQRLGSRGVTILDPRMRDLRPFIMAMVVGFSTGMMSLSRCYIVPTYGVAGIAAAYLQVTAVAPPGVVPRLDGVLVKRMGLVAVAFLAFIYVFIRVAGRFG